MKDASVRDWKNLAHFSNLRQSVYVYDHESKNCEKLRNGDRVADCLAPQRFPQKAHLCSTKNPGDQAHQQRHDQAHEACGMDMDSAQGQPVFTKHSHQVT